MLSINELTKTYFGKTQVTALGGISLHLDKGVYGLLGPNGAGKSTLMKILTLSLTRDSGEILWNGEDINSLGDNYRKILGYMPQQQNLYNAFTGRMFLNYFAALKDIPKSKTDFYVEKIVAAVNLQDKIDDKIKNYSGGMKQRLLLACATMGEPKFLILDEPTAGLDPKERIRVRNLAKSASENGIVLFATHVVSDVESIANEIIIMNKGLILAQGEPKHLIQSVENAKSLEDVYIHYFGSVEKQQ